MAIARALAVTTQLNQHLRTLCQTPWCPHLFSHYCKTITTIHLFCVLIYRRLRLASSWHIQNSSKCALNTQTRSVSVSIELHRLYQMLTIQAEKEYFRVS